MRFIFPCELAARRIVPSIRSALVIILQKDGYSVYQISKFLNLTPAAVSQYVSKKRGGKIIDTLLADQEIVNKLKEIASVISKENNRDSVTMEICSICELIRNKYPDVIKTFPYR